MAWLLFPSTHESTTHDRYSRRAPALAWTAILAAFVTTLGGTTSPALGRGRASARPAAKASVKVKGKAKAPTKTTAKTAIKATSAPRPAKATKAAQPATPPASPEARAIVAGIQRFYDKSAGFSASFVQVVKKRGLKKGITRKGKVWLRKGATHKGKDGKPVVDNGKMRWDYPDEEIYYFSDGEILWSYERRERLAVKLPVKNSRLYQATSYLVGQGDLAGDFQVTVAKSPLKGTKALKLVPREGTGVMRSLTLIVDARTYAVKASILVDPLGDSTSLFFRDASYGEIDSKIFVWSPPKGVTVKTM